MAELSLKEEIACEICARNSDCDSYPTINGEAKHARCKEQLKQADSIIKLMLAKVDKAGLTKDMIAGEVWEFGNSYVCDNGELPTAGQFYEHIAKAQLQAIKDILEGE